MNGLLLVNKPKGITSFDVIRKLRRITGFNKIGHAGTLDPMATGLMLLLFGPATKKAGDLSKLNKTYEAEVTLGFESSTADAEGDLTRISDDVPSSENVEQALNTFIGQITQTPPIFSAIKVGGQRAYKLARKGQKVEIPSRKVTVYNLQVTSYKYPVVAFTTTVSSGTYIRSLALDLGQKLGTGAYLSGLKRTEIDKYKLSDAIELNTATEASVQESLRLL